MPRTKKNTQIFDPETLGLPDDERMIAEYARLHALFKDLPERTLETVRKLISRAAFLTVTLEKLELDILENGYAEKYQNGQFQSGTKQSVAAATHVSYMKNMLATMKQLTDLLAKHEPEVEDDFTRF